MISFLKKFYVEEEGQDMVEYGLVIALVVAAGLVAIGSFSTAIENGFTSVATAITTNL